jgi:hypothetical protein
MRRPCTTSWSPFPPRTREAQFDEKWAFVAKKEANCDPTDPADAHRGDHWDHVALDPDHRLVVGVVTGKRTAENTVALVRDFRRRTSGRLMGLITTDEYAPYRGAILEAYGETITPPRSGKRGRPRKAYKAPPAGLIYATVHKTRSKGRVVKVEQRIIFGTAGDVGAALARSASSRAVNTSFVERQNGTDRNRNAGRPAGATASRRTGRCIGRSPTSRCTAIISAGRCGRCESRVRMGPGSGGPRRWRRGWPIMSGLSRSG